MKGENPFFDDEKIGPEKWLGNNLCNRITDTNDQNNGDGGMVDDVDGFAHEAHNAEPPDAREGNTEKG